MELKINQIALPEKVTFNDEEIETALSAKLEELRTVVYTDDQIKDAKAERAKWNSLKKALNDEWIRVEREFMTPLEDFKGKIKHFCSMIDDTVLLIDKQVKEYEAKKREEKADQISEIWQGLEHSDWLDLGDIYNDKWLNATYKLEQIKDELETKIATVNIDVKTIESLKEFSFEALEEYKRTLNINDAIREGQRLADIQRRKKEAEEAAAKAMAERQAAEEMAAAERATIQISEDSQQMEIKIQPIEEAAAEARQPVAFQAYMTYAEALELRAWFKERNIEYTPVRI